MKSLLLLGCLTLTFSNTYARGGIASSDPSRTLKGVLKFYKEQPRITDSESLEFESNEANNANSRPVNAKIKETIATFEKVLKDSLKFKGQSPILDSVDITTIQPSSFSSDDLLFSNVQHLSKSDLYADDPEEDEGYGCIEGDVSKVLCNTCVCSDGKLVCSKRDCEREKPLPPLQKASSKRKGIIKYHKANAESNSQNETNSVEDLENGANFTISGENVNSTTAGLTQCIDGRTKPVDCNQCICALGKWACTKMSCIALSLREKASFSGGEFLKTVGTLKEYMNIDEDCMEGEAKQMGCNQCVCHQNSWACSDFACAPTTPPVTVHVEEACQTEEDVKSKDCNICSCRRGIWVCTKNDCKKFGDRYYNPVSQKHTSSEHEHDI